MVRVPAAGGRLWQMAAQIAHALLISLMGPSSRSIVSPARQLTTTYMSPFPEHVLVDILGSAGCYSTPLDHGLVKMSTIEFAFASDERQAPHRPLSR